MKVIGDERPGKAFCFRLQKKLAESAEEVLIVSSFAEYLAPFYSSGDDMMKGAGRVYSGLSWHAAGCSMLDLSCKCEYLKGVPKMHPEGKYFVSSEQFNLSI